MLIISSFRGIVREEDSKYGGRTCDYQDTQVIITNQGSGYKSGYDVIVC